jgi:hypothetical protein
MSHKCWTFAVYQQALDDYRHKCVAKNTFRFFAEASFDAMQYNGQQASTIYDAPAFFT